jgi:nitrogen regulatory protein P-II 1
VKRIEAIIRPFRVEEVKSALAQVGIEGMTVLAVKGCGRQKGHAKLYKETEYRNDFLPKLMVAIVLEDCEVETAIIAIGNAARTGKTGDGMIFISTIDDVVRIRSGKRGEHAFEDAKVQI